MRIVFLGSPQVVVPVLESLVANRHQVLAVYTPPDRPAGRGQIARASPVKEAAEKLAIPVVQVANLKQPETVGHLASFKAEAIVVAAFGYLLPPEVLGLFDYGCLNIHPSLLPKYRGASPVAAAILAGDEFAGVSVMRLDAGLDSGPLLAQAQIAISAIDTTGSLTEKLFQAGGGLLLEVLADLPRGKIEAREQGPKGVSFSPELAKEAGEIDWKLPAVQIWRKVRAFQPWPGAFTFWQGKQVKILEARPIATGHSANPGQAIVLPEGAPGGSVLGIGTGTGILAVSKIQMEGKRPLSADEFLRGQKNFPGAILGR